MPKNKLNNLRDLMFETIERLMDDEDSMDARKAKAIADVGRVVVDSAKVEVDIARLIKTRQIPKNFVNVPNSQNDEPKLLIGDEIPDCKCGETIFPADVEKSILLRLNYPRCGDCLTFLPENSKDLNGGGK